jgi:hypothetical protein
VFSGRIGSGGGLALILYSLPRRFPLEPGTLYVRIHFFIVFVPLFLKFTMGARGHGFEPLHRPIVFARTKRPIGKPMGHHTGVCHLMGFEHSLAVS